MTERELPITGSQDSALADWIATQACMRWPEDGSEIQNRISAMSQFQPSGKLAEIAFRPFFEAPAGAVATGLMLCLMLSFAVHKSELKAHTFNKTSFLMTKLPYKLNKPISKNESTIRNDWAKYKNVAHLWAAYELTLEDKYFNFDKLPSYNDKAGLHSFLVWFLSTAEYAAKLIARYRLITDWNPWRVPSEFPLAHREPKISPPNKWAIEALKRYRAPKSL
jgi:hypothetical protein